MTTTDPVPGASTEPPAERPEYSFETGSRHKAAAKAQQARGSRLRVSYFLLASLWGFAIGAGGLASAITIAGRPVELTPMLLVGLVPAVLLAGVGGWVASSAYREARNRMRR